MSFSFGDVLWQFGVPVPISPGTEEAPVLHGATLRSATGERSVRLGGRRAALQQSLILRPDKIEDIASGTSRKSAVS
jgi:hypothetical protein